MYNLNEEELINLTVRDEIDEIIPDITEREEMDESLNLPPTEPQARCLYDDCFDKERKVGYSTTPFPLSYVGLSRQKYSTADQAREAFDARRRQGFDWVDPCTYWTVTHWIFRGVKK